MIRRVAPALLAIAGCGGSSSTEAPAAKAPPGASLISEDVTFPVGDRKIPGTLVRPAQGTHPGLVVMAGSGPTDRDWNSPLIPSTNGSGKLLAEAIAKTGVVVLRFDKAAVGGNKVAVDKVEFDTYRDEGRAALAYLRTRREVDPRHLFIAGHSEGGLHAMRVALLEGNQIAGLLLLSSAGRTLKDVLTTQLENQLRTALTPDMASAEIASLHKALDDFVAGRPVDPKTASTLPPIQQLIAGLVAPSQTKLIRDMFSFDPTSAVSKLAVPVLVFNGQKDIQVDPELDAGHLEQALRAAKRDVTKFLAPDADHVLKHETRTIAEIRANLATLDYNGPTRVIDAASVDAIAGWIAKRAK